MNPKMYMLVGMIASGKSSYCKNAAKAGHLTLNDDSVVNMLHADNYSLYAKELKVLYKSIETSIASLALCHGKSIIIDRGVNVSDKGRKRWLALAGSYDVPCEAIIFPHTHTSVHATRRVKHDGRGYGFEYWFDVANHHESIYVEPTLGEGFDKIHQISFEQIETGMVIDG